MTKDIPGACARAIERLYETSTHPDGARARAGDPLEWVKAGSAEDAIRRLEIYAALYETRLVAELADVYRATRALLGAARFHLLALRYLELSPPVDPVLRRIGDRFVELLAGEDPGWAFELAQLERALHRIAFAPDPAPNTLAPHEQLSFVHPTDEGFAAILEGTIPADLPRDPVQILVWRAGLEVRLARLDEDEAAGRFHETKWRGLGLLPMI
jgi:hypothetical protein